ncbi:MAG TPA: rhodanese-like domain-containing protein [Acidobacteriaceae bacterium]|nr:rhodanese-like domain-containing protein [Acidobacteriaceae bacterium]
MPLVPTVRPASAPGTVSPCILKFDMDHEISVKDLQKKMKESASTPSAESFYLLDVREPWEAALCCLPGAQFIPMGDMPSRAHQELDPDAHIVVYCHHGMRSLSVVFWLRQQGFERAQSLAGGIEAWARVADPSMARY